MAKFCGQVGFMETTETVPGVWTEDIVERSYTGDVIRNGRRWDNSQYLNDNFNVNNSISIVADSFAIEHLHLIRYVTWMGAKWKVSSVEIQRPRLVLSISGVYNDGN